MTGVTSVRDLTYANVEGVSLRFDLHMPESPTGPLPLALYLHGGGWARGLRTDYEASRQIPVAASGVAVASIDYRLSGDACWPAQLEDAREALRVVPEVIAGLGVELSDRRTMWGCSAGGHVALMAGLLASADGGAPLDAVAAWFPPTDLTVMGDAPKPVTARMPLFVPEGATPPPFERMLVGGGLRDDLMPRLVAASPVSHVSATATTPEILLVHGDDDALIPSWHTKELHARLVDAGARSAALVVPGATHEDPRFEVPSVLGATAAHLRGHA